MTTAVTALYLAGAAFVLWLTRGDANQVTEPESRAEQWAIRGLCVLFWPAWLVFFAVLVMLWHWDEWRDARERRR